MVLLSIVRLHSNVGRKHPYYFLSYTGSASESSTMHSNTNAVLCSNALINDTYYSAFATAAVNGETAVTLNYTETSIAQFETFIAISLMTVEKVALLLSAAFLFIKLLEFHRSLKQELKLKRFIRTFRSNYVDYVPSVIPFCPCTFYYLFSTNDTFA